MTNSFQSAAGEFLVTANGNITISGLAFQPKIVLFITDNSASDDSFNNHSHLGFGYGVSSSNRHALVYRSRDNVTPSSSLSYHYDNYCSVGITPTGAFGYSADMVSLNADGFTINVTNFSSNATVKYIAIGGDDLQVSAGAFETTTGAGPQTVSGVGFQPDSVLFASVGVVGTLPAGRNNGIFSMGAANDSNNVGFGLTSEDAVNPTDTTRCSRGSRSIQIQNFTNQGANGFVGAVNSFNSDGFEIGVFANANAAAIWVIYIAFLGVETFAGTFLSQTSTGNFSVAGLTFRPETGIFFSGNYLADGTNQSNAKGNVGFVDENSNFYAISTIDEDNVNPSNNSRYVSDNTYLYQNILVGSFDGNASFVSWDATGFTLNMTNADPAQASIFYLVFGDAIQQISPDEVDSDSNVEDVGYHWYFTPDLQLVGATNFGVEVISRTPYVTLLNQRLLNDIAGQAKYKVRLLDTDGSLIAEFDNWNSLVWTRLLNVRTNIRFHPISNDSRRSLFTKDRILEVWRKNDVVGLDWYKECEGLYRTKNQTIDVNDRNSFVAFALGGIDLLVRSYIMWHDGTPQAVKSGIAETIIKEYVYENAGAGALTTSGRILDNVMPNFIVQGSSGLGVSWTGEKSFTELYQTIREIADSSDIDFEVIGEARDDGYYWTFETYYQQKNNRTIGNSEGNTPVIFEVGRGNMRIPVFTQNATVEKNTVYAISQGRDGDAQIAIARNFTSINESPWNRCEFVVKASNNELENATLSSVAIARLEEEREKVEISFDVMQSPSCYYGKDYTFGDRVTSIFDSQRIDKKIRSVKGIVSEPEQGEQLNIEFERQEGVGGYQSD